MREKRWTPGPWEIMNDGDIFGPLGGDSGDGVRADSDDGWQIAEVDVYSAFVDGRLVELGSAPRKANAHLIKAAPLLVEALEQAVEAWKNEYGSCPPWWEDALAKAYGEK